VPEKTNFTELSESRTGGGPVMETEENSIVRVAELTETVIESAVLEPVMVSFEL
jgi:hypothetical protein